MTTACYGARRGAVCSNSCSCCFQNSAKKTVPWPLVSSLPGIRNRRAFFTRLSSRSMIPVSGGLRSSSAGTNAAAEKQDFGTSRQRRCNHTSSLVGRTKRTTMSSFVHIPEAPPAESDGRSRTLSGTITDISHRSISPSRKTCRSMRTLFVEGGARFLAPNGWQTSPKQAIVSLAEGALPDRTVNAVLAPEPRVQSRPRAASADPGSPAPPRKSGRARRAPEGRSERHAPIGMRRSR